MEPEVTAKNRKSKKTEKASSVLDNKKRHFEAILQILELAVALLPNNSSRHIDKLSSETRKDFGYVDAITNLMVRDVEVVAAVACGGADPNGGIIFNSPSSETPSNVRPQYTSYV